MVGSVTSKVTAGIVSDGLIRKVIAPGQKRTLEINDGFVNKDAVRAEFTMEGWEYIR